MKVWLRRSRGSPREISSRFVRANTSKQIYSPGIGTCRFRKIATPGNTDTYSNLVLFNLSGCLHSRGVIPIRFSTLRGHLYSQINPLARRCRFEFVVSMRFLQNWRQENFADISVPQSDGLYVCLRLLRYDKRFVLFTYETDVKCDLTPAKSRLSMTRGRSLISRPVVFNSNRFTSVPNSICQNGLSNLSHKKGDNYVGRTIHRSLAFHKCFLLF